MGETGIRQRLVAILAADAADYTRLVAAELGADYVVEGSVRKAGMRLRITAQLLDGLSGNHIWAERYDRDLADIFDLQDEVTGTISARIEPEFGAVERPRAERKPTRNLDAWDCYHLGLSHMYRFDLEGNLEAQRLFRRAIALDPKFAAGVLCRFGNGVLRCDAVARSTWRSPVHCQESGIIR